MAGWMDNYQNGGELKYYQNGTDFKPKSIGQFGKTVSHEYIDTLKEFENTTKNFGYHIDSRKIPTIGYGHRLTDKEKKEKIIYIGEEKVPFDKFKGAEGQMYADRLLQEQDIPSHYDKMIKLYGDKYSQPVKDVLFDIVYQQGNAKNSAKFLKGSYPNIKEWQDYLTSAANESSGGDKTRMQWRANALSKDPSNWFLGNMLPYAQPAVRDMTNLPIYKYGGEIKQDDRGYWNPDNWGKPVQINTNRITMKGVDVPLLGISDAQDVQLMQPNGEYLFKGTSVVELPIAPKGKTINGWMDKYNK